MCGKRGKRTVLYPKESLYLRAVRITTVLTTIKGIFSQALNASVVKRFNSVTFNFLIAHFFFVRKSNQYPLKHG